VLVVSDRLVVLSAVVVAVGAWLAWSIPWWVVLASGVSAVALRRPSALLVALGLLSALLASRSWAGMHPPDARSLDGVATLVSDPVPVRGAVHAELKVQGRHYDAWARGGAAAALAPRLAGERVQITARIAAGGVPDHLRVRHVVARIDVERLTSIDGGMPLSRGANLVRRVLVRGATSMDIEQRSLFTGLVVGDDRDQPVEVADDFRGAGLAHLLAVSGQNVAFVLAAVAPLLRRLGWRSRVVATVAVLVLFATITRYEPSVLRATVMAGLACFAGAVGRPGPALRLLAIAVAALVLVDPFLVRSVGFGLSVGASLGILLLSRRITGALPLPAGLARPLGVIAAAQLGVAPLVLVVFGGLPVASLPANLLAEPVAGLVMMWGASAGLLAGIVPAALATVMHVPTVVALWWIAGVARRCTDAGLGEMGPVAVVVATVMGVAAVRGRGRRSWLGRLFAAGALAALVSPAVALRLPSARESVVAGAGVVRRDHQGAVLLVDEDANPPGALRALRAHGVDHLARIELPSRSSALQSVVAVIQRRIPVDQVVVLDPDRSDDPG
jgi:competence protein ComEC